MKHVLFLHIPKTGGTSIETMIRQSDGPVNPGRLVRFIEDTDWTDLESYKYSFTHTPLYVQDILPHPLFTFTFLRDPVDRVISTYNHILRAPTEQTYEMVMAERLSLAEALTHPVVSIQMTNVATRMLGAHLDLRPAVPDVEAMHIANALAWETVADEFTYRRALKRLGELDFVGFMERLEEDGLKLAALLGIKNAVVPFENRMPNDYEWLMPIAVRSPEIEEAVRRHSFFDCCLYEEARKFFWHHDASARSAREHFSSRATSDARALFDGSPRGPASGEDSPQGKSIPGASQAGRFAAGNSKTVLAERLIGRLEAELVKTHERAAFEITIRDEAFREADRQANVLRHELARRNIKEPDGLKMPALEPAEAAKIRVSLEGSAPAERKVREEWIMAVIVANEGTQTVSACAPYPVNLSYHWYRDGAGAPALENPLVYGGPRSPILPPLAAGESQSYRMLVIAPAEPGRHWLRITFVQEHVLWFEGLGPSSYADLLIDVRPFE